MKKITLFFILMAIISLTAYVFVAIRPYSNRHIENEYTMAKALLSGDNPYRYLAEHAGRANPYPIINYLVYLPFASVIHDPRAVKLTQGIFGWAIGILIYFAHKKRKEGMLRAILYWGTYHFYIAFARFSITEPAMLFFTILGLIFLMRKRTFSGLSGILTATLTKYVPGLVFPFLFVSQPKLRRSIFVTFIVIICIAVAVTISNPWYISTIVEHSKSSSQALRLDNLSLLSASYLPVSRYPLAEKIIPVVMIGAFLLTILFLLIKAGKQRLSVLASYLLPISAWLIFPPNNFLWGNFYFWNSIVLLLVPDIWAVRMYIFYLLPEYVLKMGNIYPYPMRAILYGATYFCGVIASISIIKNIFKSPSKDTHTRSAFIILFFILQVVLIVLIGLLRKNIFWFL